MPPRDEPQDGLGQAIRRLRTDRGWSQEALAEAAGLHLTWISELESGQVNPSWGTTRRLAAALEVRHAVLATLAEELQEAPRPGVEPGG
jgi:transcriptional regulator with XRE-family HTH domain